MRRERANDSRSGRRLSEDWRGFFPFSAILVWLKARVHYVSKCCFDRDSLAQQRPDPQLMKPHGIDLGESENLI